jgi:hypothetical protein
LLNKKTKKSESKAEKEKENFLSKEGEMFLKAFCCFIFFSCRYMLALSISYLFGRAS